VADSLFIRLSDDAAAQAAWATFAPTGQLTSSVARGSLSAARSASEGRRVTVLVPGIDVVTTQAVLPGGSASRLRQIVPFSLEDSLADDVETLAFAVGARLDSGASAVAVVAKARLEAWLASLAEAGITPYAVHSETEGVPDVPGTLMLLLEGARIYGRCSGRSAFVLDGFTLKQALDSARAEGALEGIKHVVAYVAPNARARFQAELAKLPDEFESAEAKLAPDGLFPHLAATVAQRSATNLLQGSYAAKSNWLELAKPWRVAAGLLVTAGVLALVLQAASYWSLSRADGVLGEQLTESCQRLVGASRASQCDAEVQERLRNDGAASGETFLSTLEAVAAARNAAMRIGALSYRNQTMDLQVIVANVDELDAFASGLEQTRRFKPTIESANQSEGGVEGRLQIVGAQR
jgi:general secretion pathway protein L